MSLDAPPVAVTTRDWRRLSRILVGYGAVGLVVAALALLGLLIGVGRVNAFADRFGGDLGGVATTLEHTSDVLDKAATTASGFGGTIDGTTGALDVVGGDIDAIAPRLDAIADQTAAISILGSNPLASVSGLFRDISTQLRDVRGQLTTVATSLTANRDALGANATSLGDLAAQTRALSTRLDGASLTGALDDLRILLVVVLGVAAFGAAVPAAGAIVVGLWLRRWPAARTLAEVSTPLD